MDKHQKDGDGLLMIRYMIEPGGANDFKKWRSATEAVVKTFAGFIDIAALDHLNENDYYYIIIRFDSGENANAWLYSDERKAILNDSHCHWLTHKQEVIFDWNIFWYRIFEGTKKWKQWVVTFLAVYPLTLIIPSVVKILSSIIPLYFFAGIISALLISGFMIFPIMPFVLNLFKKWLHA